MFFTCFWSFFNQWQLNLVPLYSVHLSWTKDHCLISYKIFMPSLIFSFSYKKKLLLFYYYSTKADRDRQSNMLVLFLFLSFLKHMPCEKWPSCYQYADRNAIKKFICLKIYTCSTIKQEKKKLWPFLSLGLTSGLLKIGPTIR